MKLIDYVKAAAKADRQPGALRIAVLRSFTCEMLESILTVELQKIGIGSELFFGGFNSFFQDTFDESGELYRFKPNVIIYAVRTEEIIPESRINSIMCAKDSAETEKYLHGPINELDKMLSFAREKSGAEIIVNNFAKPTDAPQWLHTQSRNGLNNFIRRLNLALSEICSGKSIYCADIDDMTADMGRIHAYDSRMWELAKNPYTFEFYVRLARLYTRYINTMLFPRRKCIVLDLDNTLWSGVIGESRPDECRPYTVFQTELKSLAQTGILLAAASKNNEEDVTEFFSRHEDMPLRPEDFSVMKVNWKDKPCNLAEIAKELNIHPSGLVFFDDNPAEREMVKKMLSDVCVVDFPNDAHPGEQDFVSALKGLLCLDYYELTDEDINRTAMYREQRGRAELERSSCDTESFLRGLEMKACIYSLPGQDLTRASQMTQKTNQFNLTAKRYSEADLLNLTDRGFYIYGLRLGDKFGGYGLSGLMIIEPSDGSWIVDSFLLSCRIMSRRVEYLFMAEIIRRARENSIGRIKASFIPTGRNKPVENLFKEMGFTNRNGFWEWDCAADFGAPDYILLSENIQ